MRKSYRIAVIFVLLLTFLFSITSSVYAADVDIPSVFTKQAESITGCTTVDKWLSSETAPAYLVTGIILDYTGAIAVSAPDGESVPDSMMPSAEDAFYIGGYAADNGELIVVAGINKTGTHLMVFLYIPGDETINFTAYNVNSGITDKELDILFQAGYRTIKKEDIGKAMIDILKDE